MLGGRFLSSVGVVGVDLGSRAVKMLQVRDTDEGLKVVGAARIDATPTQPVVLAGYGGRTKEYEGIDTKLWARAMIQLRSSLGRIE